MTYLNLNQRTTRSTSNDKFQPMGRTATMFGVFIGYVKEVGDVQRMGRLKVWIPEFGSTEDDPDGWIIASYCSPFAGATDSQTASKTNTQTFEGTQTSYGMWFTPPDINNQVLIMFINGDPGRPIWIGCLYQQYMNEMVPGMAATTQNYQYNGTNVPVAEYNKWDTTTPEPALANKPYEGTKFKGLGNQGLITDPNRGITTSSARRGAPSEVYGILTPGPLMDTTSQGTGRRKGGSSFIMDDYIGSEYVQLATKSGAQIRIDETNGFVYLINRDGTAWVQMDKAGNIDIFGATNISMRAQQDINLRADRDINIEAGQNVYIKAAKDTTTSTTSFTYDVNNVPTTKSVPFYNYVGAGAGSGGNIEIQALGSYNLTSVSNMLLSTSANFGLNATNGIDVLTTSNCNLNAAAFNFTASGNYNISASSFNVTSSTGTFSGEVGVVGTLNVQGGANLGTDVNMGDPVTVNPGPTPTAANPATPAVKGLNNKVNVLATWADDTTKFKRNSEAFLTTASRLPTFEPCPEHDAFTFVSVAGYNPPLNPDDLSYVGSGGPGGGTTTPAAQQVQPPPYVADSVVVKDFNINAFRCQITIHEGVRYQIYPDLVVHLPLGGYAHLLRANEVPLFPMGSTISKEQVETWFQQDTSIAVKGVQSLLGIDVWNDLSDIRKRACADLCYNMGRGTLSTFRTFLSAMRAGNYQAAGAALENSVWFKQVASRGPKIVTMIVNNIDPNGCDKKFPPANA